MKQATKRPAQLKEKKVEPLPPTSRMTCITVGASHRVHLQEKNKETNVFGETTGRLHMEKQDLTKLQTRKMKVAKRPRTLV